MADQQTPATSTTLPTGRWELDSTATTVTVSATKLLAFTIPATLTVSSGTIDIDASGNVAGIEVVADAGSYTSKNDKRNEHVRSADFLDAEQYPTISFHADSVTPSGGGYTATGTVTIKGSTAPITLQVSDVSVSGTSGTFTATGTVDRNAVGVDKMPSLLIGNELTIDISATARSAS